MRIAKLFYSRKEWSHENLPMIACPDFNLQDICINKNPLSMAYLPNPEYYTARRRAIRSLRKFQFIQYFDTNEMYLNENGETVFVNKKLLYKKPFSFTKFPLWLQLCYVLWTFNPVLTGSYAFILVFEHIFYQKLKSGYTSQHPA